MWERRHVGAASRRDPFGPGRPSHNKPLPPEGRQSKLTLNPLVHTLLQNIQR